MTGVAIDQALWAEQARFAGVGHAAAIKIKEPDAIAAAVGCVET